MIIVFFDNMEIGLITRPKLCVFHQRPCGPMDKVSDYGTVRGFQVQILAGSNLLDMIFDIILINVKCWHYIQRL